jgi:hypothetical protein
LVVDPRTEREMADGDFGWLWQNERMSDMELVITTTGDGTQRICEMAPKHNLGLNLHLPNEAQRALKAYPSKEDWKQQLKTSRVMCSPALRQTPSPVMTRQLLQQLLALMMRTRTKVMQQQAKKQVALTDRRALSWRAMPALSRHPAMAILLAATFRRGR